MHACPICRARLKGRETCRRCGADLSSAIHTAKQSQQLLHQALHAIHNHNYSLARRCLSRARINQDSPLLQQLQKFLEQQIKHLSQTTLLNMQTLLGDMEKNH
ncbi:hypothetical protein ACQZV8_14275 [Magnetococcales bacterium HHB-1]